jgi:hypothetical protein
MFKRCIESLSGGYDCTGVISRSAGLCSSGSVDVFPAVQFHVMVLSLCSGFSGVEYFLKEGDLGRFSGED